MKSKKGLELAVTTVIIIVLSISVLTILIIFVNTQTGFLNDFLDLFRGESNIDEVISACNSLASTESYYAYCCDVKEVKFNKNNSTKQTCSFLRKNYNESNVFLLKISELNCDAIICA